VHDIGELLHLVPASIKVPLTAEEQERLTFYATTARYPGDYEPVSREVAEEMISAAKKLRDAIRRQLPQDALSP
jgi:HEPN domain-containing protein